MLGLTDVVYCRPAVQEAVLVLGVHIGEAIRFRGGEVGIYGSRQHGFETTVA